MLHLIEGGFASVAHDELNDRIKKSVLKKRKTYLFVPEQQTLVCESEMCELLPPDAPLSFEVTNFTRFANTAFREIGGVGGKYCTGTESTLIMWRVLTELSGVLSMTRGKRSIPPGLVDRALAAIKEAERHGISPDQIGAALKSGEITDARLSAKLYDLSLIYSLFRDLTSGDYGSLEEDAEILAEKLGERPEFLSECDIYVDGFTSFTEAQYRLLAVMMRQTTLTVTLTLPKGLADRFEYGEPKKAEARLKDIARREGVKILLSQPSSPNYAFSDSIREIGERLFSTGGKIDNDYLHDLNERGGRVRIFEARDPFEECDFVAADIKRKVMSGASYRDFAIVARNAGGYVGILDSALLRAKIPHFISKRRDLSSFEAIKLINTAYQIIFRGFKREDVLTYAKCGLTGISREECDAFELYVCRWSIDGRRFTDGIEWNMNPRGYRELCEDDAQKLVSISATRERLISPLLLFRDDALAAKTVREQATALFGFLTRIDLEASLYERAKELHARGEFDSAEENARLFETVCAALDTLVDVLGDTEISIDAFSSLLSLTLKEVSIARLPLSKDQVTVGSADMLRVRDKRHVYLIGVNAGEFPASVTDSSYFSERDKATLAALGMPIEPDLSVRNARELYCFLRAFLTGRDTVTLLYTKLSASMSPLMPAEPISRIGELTDGKIQPVLLSTLTLRERIFSPSDALMLSGTMDESCYPEVKAALGEVGYSSIVTVAEGSPINRNARLGDEALALVYKGDIYMSQSRLDQFLSCPFAYYAKYLVGLKEERSAELSPDVIGSFIHSVLENFFRAVYERGGSVGELSPDERVALAEDASRKYIEDVLGGGFGEARAENAIARLCRAAGPIIDGLCEEFGSCKYRPTFFELSTYGRSADSPDPVVFRDEEGRGVVISGIVDRVDTMQVGDDVYVRVVDYKSGSKKFDPSDLERGENLQMFIYLKSIVDTDKPAFREKIGVKNDGELIPAGVLYVKTSLKDATVDTPDDEGARVAARALSERDGMLLDDRESINAMNPDYLPKGAVEDGGNRRYDMDGWRRIESTLKDAVLGLTGRMRSGDASATPKETGSKSPCTYCPYKPMCRSVKKK